MASSTSSINPALVAEVAGQYKAFLRHLPPAVGGVHISKSSTACDDGIFNVTARLSARDLHANRSRGALQQFVVLPDRPSVLTPSVASPLGLETMFYSLSPSGQKAVLFRKDDKQKLFLEVWSKDNPMGALKISSSVAIDSKLMGDPLAEGWFAATGDGGVAWTEDARYCAFVAEAAPLESPPLYESVAKPPAYAFASASSATNNNGTASADKAPAAGLTNLWSREGGGVPQGAARETWGERYENVRSPRIFLLDVEKAAIYPLPGVAAEDALSLGQATWAPLDTAATEAAVAVAAPRYRYRLAFTSWPHADRRLGSVYCYNRPSFVSAVDLTDFLAAKQLQSEEKTAGSGEAKSEKPSADAAEPGSSVVHTVVSAFEHEGAAKTSDVGEGLPVLIARSPRFLPPASSADGGVLRLFYLTVTGPNILTHGGNSNLATAVLESSSSGALKLNGRPRQLSLLTEAAAVGAKEPFFFFTHMLPSRPFGSPYNKQVVPLYANATVRGKNMPVVFEINASSFSEAVVKPLELPHGGAKSAAIVGMMHQQQAVGAEGGGPYSVVAVSTSTPAEPESLSLHMIREGKSVKAWPLLSSNAATPFDRLSFVDFSTFYPDSVDPSVKREVQCTLIFNKECKEGKGSKGTVQRLLVVPHGGPHGSFTGDFLAPYAFLPLLGSMEGAGGTNSLLPFACLLVNFTGSTGWTEESNAVLPGRIGELDSGEVQMAALTALALGGDRKAFDELTSKGVECKLLPSSSGAAIAAKKPTEIQVSDRDGRTTLRSAFSQEAALGFLSSSSGCDFNSQVDEASGRGGVFIVGGSHGGFLTGHAVTQYPSFFAAACLRNPVTNLATLLGTSDIAEWSMLEGIGVQTMWGRIKKHLKAKREAMKDASAAGTSTSTSLAEAFAASGAEFALRSYAQAMLRALVPDHEALAQLFRVSPLSLVSNNTTPSLLVLGLKDRRVTPSQGFEWHYALRGAGEAPSEVLAFPEDVHAVDKPVSEAEAWAHMAAWLSHHATAAAARDKS